MPVIFEKEINNAKKLAVWEITEPIDFFLKKLNQMEDSSLSKKRQMEQAACGVLLNYMCDSSMNESLHRDHYGRPYLENYNITVSLSHSRNMMACLLDFEGKAAGIDIELMRDGITATSKKFVNNTDITPYEGILNLHLIWGAKEVMYKMHGIKELDFLSQLFVKFDKNFRGRIFKNNTETLCNLDFINLNNFILVWNI